MGNFYLFYGGVREGLGFIFNLSSKGFVKMTDRIKERREPGHNPTTNPPTTNSVPPEPTSHATAAYLVAGGIFLAVWCLFFLFDEPAHEYLEGYHMNFSNFNKTCSQMGLGNELLKVLNGTAANLPKTNLTTEQIIQCHSSGLLLSLSVSLFFFVVWTLIPADKQGKRCFSITNRLKIGKGFVTTSTVILACVYELCFKYVKGIDKWAVPKLSGYISWRDTFADESPFLRHIIFACEMDVVLVILSLLVVEICNCCAKCWENKQVVSKKVKVLLRPVGRVPSPPNYPSEKIHTNHLSSIVDKVTTAMAPDDNDNDDEEEGIRIGIIAMGGQGKTSLLRRLAYQPDVLEHFSSGVVWINVDRSIESEDVLLMQISSALDITITIEEKDEKNRTSIIVKRLQKMDGSTMLLLLDNVWEDSVPGAEGVKQFLQQCPPGVSFVMTSRDATAVDRLGGTAIYLNEPSKATAVEMLQKQCEEVDFGDFGEDLVNACGRHVLALEHIGTQLRLKKSTPEKMLEKMRNKTKKLQKRFQKRGKKKKDDNEVSVFACLEMSFDNLDEKDQKKERRVALFLSVFPPEKTIPLGALLLLCTSISADDVDIDDRDDLGEIVKELELRSIISKVMEDGPVTLVTLHGFMHEVLVQKREADTSSEEHKRLGEHKSSEEHKRSESKIDPTVAPALKYFDAYHLVMNNSNHDALKRAKELYGEELSDEEEIVLTAMRVNGAALRFCSKKLQGEERVVRAMMEQMGSSYGGMLQFGDDATEMVERILRDDLKVLKNLGSDRPDTLTAVNNLGSLLYAQNKFEEAKKLFQDALKGQEKVLGVDDPSTLTSANDLGMLLQDKGEYDEAEKLLRRALEGRKRVLDVIHPSTLNSADNLGSLLMDRGKLDEAELLFRSNLKVKESVLGNDNPSTLISVNNLGLVLKKLRRLEDAGVQYRRALEVRERVLGANHANTLASLNNLGMLLQDKGEYHEAEILLRRSSEGQSRNLGADHLNTLNACGNLGLLLMKRGDESGEEMVRDVLSSLLLPPHSLPETHPWIKKFNHALDL